MRLNLLPVTVKKSGQTRSAVFISVLVAAACIAAAAFLVIDSGNQLKYAKEADDALAQPYEDTKTLQQASVKKMAEITGVARNVSLATTMDRHNAAYPQLYGAVKPYIPDFFRVTEINATPAGPGQTNMTLTGVIGSFQDYADLMLALLRIPPPYGRVVAISRAGFVHTEPFVPPLDQADQTGRPHRPGETPVPDDPLLRLQYFVNKGAGTGQGYLALSNYGSGQPGVRGPRPNESLITVQLTLPYNLQTPDPKATLNLFGGSPATAGGPGAGAGPGPVGPTGPPSRGLPPPGAGTSPGGRRGGAPSGAGSSD